MESSLFVKATRRRPDRIYHDSTQEAFMTLSRRAFAQILGAGAAAAALPVPRLFAVPPMKPTLVRLNANENPYGPSPAAIGAMRDAFGMASRYPDDEAEELVADIAKLHGVAADEVILGDGSSEILKLVAAAYTSPSRSVVIADPTFEAIVHYAKANRDTIKKLDAQKSWDTMNVMALVAARASLADGGFVGNGRKRNAETRAHVVERLGAMGYKVIPSETNFVMIDIRRDVKPVIAGMRTHGVHVGRLFPALPHHLRVTIGTPEEMQQFIDAFRRIEG